MISDYEQGHMAGYQKAQNEMSVAWAEKVKSLQWNLTQTHVRATSWRITSYILAGVLFVVCLVFI